MDEDKVVWKELCLEPPLQKLYKLHHLYKHDQGVWSVFSRWPLCGFSAVSDDDLEDSIDGKVSWDQYLQEIKRKLSFFWEVPWSRECDNSGLFGVSSSLFELLRSKIKTDLLWYMWPGSLVDFIYRCCIVQGYVPRFLRIVDYDTVVHCLLPNHFPIVLCNLVGDYLIQYCDNGLICNDHDDDYQKNFLRLLAKVPRECAVGKSFLVYMLNDEIFAAMINLQRGPPNTFRHFIVSQFWSQDSRGRRVLALPYQPMPKTFSYENFSRE